MELIEADEVCLTARFSREEYAALMGIVAVVELDYELLNRDMLDLSREEVRAIEDGIYDISAKARVMRRGGR